MLLGKDVGPDIHKIADKLDEINLDKETLGWWVLNCQTGEEIYSQGFREALGGWTEQEFPNHESSWRLTITAKDRGKAIENYKKHIDSKSKSAYEQVVTYNTKNGKLVTLICHGIIVCWDGDLPLVMIGVHLPVE